MVLLQLGELQLPTVLLLVVLGGLALFGLKSLKHATVETWLVVRMLRLQRTEARAVDDGLVELEGEAVTADGTLDAPLTGTDCVAYQVEVERYDAGGSERNNWHIEGTFADTVPFRVADETGAVGVDATEADLSLSETHQENSQNYKQVSDRARAFFNGETDHGDGEFDLDSVDVYDGRHRLTERRLEPGSTCYLTGDADVTTSTAGETPTVGATSDSGWLGDRVPSPFFLSDDGEFDTVVTHGKNAAVSAIIGVLLVAPGVYVTGFYLQNPLF